MATSPRDYGSAAATWPRLTGPIPRHTGDERETRRAWPLAQPQWQTP